MDAESAYLKLLEAAKKYEVADGKLTFTTDDGKSLTYEATEPPDLTGTSWSVTNYNNGNQAVVGVEQGTTLTLKFATDGTVTGSGGVNTFNGRSPRTRPQSRSVRLQAPRWLAPKRPCSRSCSTLPRCKLPRSGISLETHSHCAMPEARCRSWRLPSSADGRINWRRSAFRAA